MSDKTASLPQIKISWIFLTLLAFAIFAVIASYSSRMTNDYTDFDQQRATERYATLAKLRDADREALTTADWVDQSKGTVHIPIEEAMNLEVVALKSKPIAMGSPLVAPAATTNASPATNAPPASTNAGPVATTNAAPTTNANATPSAPPTPAKETK